MVFPESGFLNNVVTTLSLVELIPRERSRKSIGLRSEKIGQLQLLCFTYCNSESTGATVIQNDQDIIYVVPIPDDSIPERIVPREDTAFLPPRHEQISEGQ